MGSEVEAEVRRQGQAESTRAAGSEVQVRNHGLGAEVRSEIKGHRSGPELEAGRQQVPHIPHLLLQCSPSPS